MQLTVNALWPGLPVVSITPPSLTVATIEAGSMSCGPSSSVHTKSAINSERRGTLEPSAGVVIVMSGGESSTK